MEQWEVEFLPSIEESHRHAACQILQRFECVADAQLDKVAESCRGDVFAGPRGFPFVHFRSDDTSCTSIAHRSSQVDRGNAERRSKLDNRAVCRATRKHI